MSATSGIPASAVSGVSAPATIQDARAAGAVVGTMLTAPLAPASGPISGPDPIAAADGKPGSEHLVVVVVKNFWDSPTVKATRNVIAISLGAGLSVIALQITGAGGVFGLDWHRTIQLAINAACVSAAAAFCGWWMKRRDNNPVKP